MLLRAEECVRLVPRAAPRHVEAETARLERAFSRGQKLAPAENAAERVELSETRALLERAWVVSAPLGELGWMHAERARELELEARLVERLGTPAASALSAERFPLPPAALARECDTFVAAAVRAGPSSDEVLHASDDESDPLSLVRRVRTRARELGIRVEIRVDRTQVATAATGAGLVSVRPRVLLTARAAERIAVHELHGHALPRARALHAGWTLFRAGTRGASDDEEGRALLCEKRAGFFDAERQRELAWRHAAAVAVRGGADSRDVLRRLLELGATLGQAAALTVRVQRGGGLARELVYLPRYFELVRAFALEPGLERWFERGRIGLAAARAFAKTPPPPACGPKASAGDEAPRRSPLA